MLTKAVSKCESKSWGNTENNRAKLLAVIFCCIYYITF